MLSRTDALLQLCDFALNVVSQPRKQSHMAFGSIRMEPVFILLGQSAATAASHAIDAGKSVQQVDYAPLRERLLRDGQKLSWKPAAE